MTFLALLVACSLKSKDPSGGTSRDDSSPPDDSSAPDDSSPHDDSSPPDDSSPDDSAPPDDSSTPTDTDWVSICPSGIEANEAPVIWATTDAALSFVDGTGTAREVFTYGNPENAFATAQAIGDHVGVLAVDYDAGAELGLLESDGTLVSRDVIPDGYGSDFWVGDGYLAYSPGREGFDGVVLGSAGASTLDGCDPEGTRRRRRASRLRGR